ncbi:MAG TPA: hypothetical protein VMY43_03760 [Methanothrix sp.]|nr:hypothetical protein [Methanothrix sp.]
MNIKKYYLIVLIGALLAIAVTCLGNAITTKDLMAAKYPQNSAPITYLTGTGAVNQPPSAKSLTPDREGPQIAGPTIIWTGNAYDPDGDKLLYQFWLNGPMTGNTWKPMTGWTENNTWNWPTSPIDTGVNIIDFRVRDERHAAPWGHDSHISAEYNIDDIVGIGSTIRANSKPSLLNLKSDRTSPQDRGIKVTWTAKASDPDKDTVLYQFVLKGPSTEEQWLPMTSWTTNNIWTWDTDQSKAGIYTVEVRIRDGYHSDVESSDESKRVAYVIKQKGIIQ